MQQAGGDAPHDSQAAFQAQAVDSAVAATDNIVQQLSDEEQERVRAAVASAAQQVAQQQQQQATLMATGQAYPQVAYCCCMSEVGQCIDVSIGTIGNLVSTNLQVNIGT